MTLYYLNECLKTAYEQQRLSKTTPAPLYSHRRAVDLLVKTIEGETALGAVQGPPGTGKTSVFELGLRELIDNIAGGLEKRLIMYIAPTNHLVVEAFTRVAAHLYNKGFKTRDITSLVRVYGSRIRPNSKPEVTIGGEKVEAEELKKLMGNVDPQSVRLVFTTEYQRVASKMSEGYNEIRLIVDEASKTPYFRVFLPLAGKLVRQAEEYYPKSMIVLGDPQQAISLPEEFTIYRIPLLMSHVKRQLSLAGLKDKNFVFLDTTFRLPQPTEQPISSGFYDGKLRAYETFYDRYRRFLSCLGPDVFNAARRIVGYVIDLSNKMNVAIINGIEDALDNRIPLIVFQTRTFTAGDTYEQTRARIAYVAGLYLSAIASIIRRAGGPSLGIGVTAPYSDLAYSVGYTLEERAARVGSRRITAATVQSIIGGEADMIVTMLGKEWVPRDALSSYYDPRVVYETMYFREHQILNVQLSRHKLLMIVVGNTEKLELTGKIVKRERLYREKGWCIEKTMQEIRNLVENNNALSINMKSF